MRRAPFGFTLIELVITLVVLGILSSVVIISFSAKAQHSAVVQADEFRRALSHTQLLAISQGIRLKLEVASSGYSVCAATTTPCNSGSAINDPATGLPFSVGYPLNDGAIFINGTGSYYFDSLGRPVVDATGAALSPAYANPLTLRGGGGNCIDVTVRPITGFSSAGAPYAC